MFPTLRNSEVGFVSCGETPQSRALFSVLMIRRLAPNHVEAYWATPFPNDQFSRFTSTRLTKTSFIPGPVAARIPSAIALKRTCFCAVVRPSLKVIWIMTRSSVCSMPR